ncbi:MAG TPA: DUF4279 domain-containing protein [Pseudomonadales bacterium]|nr:DUF4279 domain-containing protein [Pseudomonadales bacterium]
MNNESAENMRPRIFHSGISFSIRGGGLNFDEISRTLGVDPDLISQKGKRYGHRQELCDFDAWYYTTGRRVHRDRPLDEHVTALWEILQPHIKYLRELKKKFELRILIQVQSPVCRFTIGQRCLKLCAELDIPLEICATVS